MTKALHALLLLMISACTGPGTPAPDAARGPLHALMTEQLALELARLNSLAFDLHRTQTELEQLRVQNSRAIAEAAARMQEAAAGIHANSPGLGLEEQNILPFHELASQLEAHAATLQQRAAAGELAQLDTLMADINSTCDACHRLYRGR